MMTDGTPELEAGDKPASPPLNDLLARLHGAQNTYIKLSELALKSKKIKEAKQFDTYAVAIFEALAILENIER